MNLIEANGIRLNYRFDGDADRPVLVLSNSLGTDYTMWDAQMPALTQRFRVLRYDTRGHGGSDVPAGPYDVEQLGRDVLGLLDALGIGKARFCGLSMGGMTGMWLGINAPARFEKLALCNTAALIGPREGWDKRIELVREKGVAFITDAVIQRWFTERFIKAHPEKIEPIAAVLRATGAEGYAANCAAVRDMDQRADIRRVTVPTLVIAGTHDLATSAADGKFVADTIPGARYVELDAAHLSNIEAEAEFTAALVGFMTE